MTDGRFTVFVDHDPEAALELTFVVPMEGATVVPRLVNELEAIRRAFEPSLTTGPRQRHRRRAAPDYEGLQLELLLMGAAAPRGRLQRISGWCRRLAP